MAEDGARILVVDDVADNRDLLARRLSRRGYETVAVEDGPTALAKLQAESFDTVLLDIRMPGMDGMEVLERIRSSFGKLELPVLMVTAETDSAQVVKAMGLGANDYVTKPIDLPVVVARIEMQLSLRAELGKARQETQLLVVDSQAMGPGFVLDGRYEIVGRLGEGGFAVVYQARQLSTEQQVAVKIMHADRLRRDGIASEEIDRFRREIRIIRTLTHPNIVRLIDSGDVHMTGGLARADSGPTSGLEATRVSTPSGHPRASHAPDADLPVPYLVTEYLEGETLGSLLAREGKLPIETAIELLLPVMSGIGAAHDAGVIHRDLTPANIFLVRKQPSARRPRILDFGIAKLTQEGRTAVSVTTSSIVGTPSYMSPEQASGVGKITGGSDQYTLAAVLYECLTGVRAYAGESFISVLTHVAAGEFTPPRVHEPDLPQALQEAMMKAMAPKAEDRHSGVDEFARALLPFAAPDVRFLWKAAL